MRAVNLVPQEARRSSRSGGEGFSIPSLTTLRPSHLVVAAGVILVLLVFLRVTADNAVNNRKATLAALQTQVSVEQGAASKLSVYTSFVNSAQQREEQVRAVAQQRFPWKRTLDQISRVMPATTSLSSLSATTSSSAGTAGAGPAGPTFLMAGCADTSNQNGVATLLRRLRLLSGVADVSFQSSTRQVQCGNSFNLSLNFGGSSPSVASTAANGSTAPTGAGTVATTAPATTATTTTTTGAAAG